MTARHSKDAEEDDTLPKVAALTASSDPPRQIDRTGMMFRWQTFGIAQVVVTAVLVAAWAALSPPVYMENDDVAIRMALEGRTAPGQPPTGFALGTHAALGWAVVVMQRVVPTIPWWDLTIAATLLWALGVLLALVWNALGSGWLAQATAVGALVVAMGPFAAGLQYTISATLAGGAAVLLTLTELRSPRPRHGVLLMATCLFLAGLLIRPMGAPAGAVLAAVLSLPLVRAKGRPLAFVPGIIGMASVFFLLAQYTDGMLYGTSAEWDAYYRYNELVRFVESSGRGDFWHYSPEVRESTGWSPNDWLMFSSLGIDPVIHGFDQVNRAYEAQAATGHAAEVLSWMFDDATDAPLARVWDLLTNFPLVAITGGTLLAAYGTRRAAAEAVAVTVFFCVVCFAIEVTFDRLPWRVLGPLQVIFVASLIITIGASRRVVLPSFAVLALGVIVAISAPILSTTTRQATERSSRSQELANEEVVALQRLSPSLVIFHAGSFPREYWWRPFHPPPPALPVVALGWNNQNPQVQRFLTDTGRQPLLHALCTSPAILIVTERSSLDAVTEYLKEHFDTSVRWTQVYAGTFRAWRCSTLNQSPTPSRSGPV